MAFSLILAIDENIVQVYNNKDVEFVYQDLVDVSLEYGRYIS